MTQAQVQRRPSEPQFMFAGASTQKAHGDRPRKGRSLGRAPNVGSRVDAVLKAFNTWAYKREQPSSADGLRSVVSRAVTEGAPLSFVLYWGKGPRSEIAPPDLTCLDYLASITARIGAAYEGGASVRLILTDTHARLNGHSANAIDSYFGDVADAAAVRGFETVRLSSLVDAAGPIVEPETDAAPHGTVLDSLVACAAKWYRGEGSTEGGAVEYYRMNMVEKRAVEIAYPEAVFVTFNSSEFRVLFPATMPVFYMYSLRKGVGVKPWFMTADDYQSSSTQARPSVMDGVSAQ